MLINSMSKDSAEDRGRDEEVETREVCFETLRGAEDEKEDLKMKLVELEEVEGRLDKSMAGRKKGRGGEMVGVDG